MAEHLGQTDEAARHGLRLIDTPMSPLAAMRLAGLLARNGEHGAAEKLIDLRLNANFNHTTIAALLTLEAQKQPPSLRTNIVHGIIDFSLLAQGRSEKQILVARLQLAQFLDPDNDVAHLLLAQQQVKSSISATRSTICLPLPATAPLASQQ